MRTLTAAELEEHDRLESDDFTEQVEVVAVHPYQRFNGPWAMVVYRYLSDGFPQAIYWPAHKMVNVERPDVRTTAVAEATPSTLVVAVGTRYNGGAW